MIPKIAWTPGREFSPISPNFEASVSQVLETIERVSPQVADIVLATAAGPAHSGMLQKAFRADRDAYNRQMQASQSLGWLKRSIERGELDLPPVLDRIVRELELRDFQDMGLSDFARRVIEAARLRKRQIAHGYYRETAGDWELLHFYNMCLPGWNHE